MTGAGTTPITIEVEQVDESGALLRWRSGLTAVAGFSADDLAAMGLSLDDVPKQNILYRIDADGFYAGVENVDEIRSVAVESLDFLAPVIGDEETVESLRRVYGALGDEELVTVFAEEPSIFHLLDGAVLAPDDSIESSDVLPNAFGGEPFPAVTTFAVTNLQDTGGCVEATLTTVPDPEEFARILFESVSDAFGVPLDEIDEAEAIRSFDVRNQVVLRIDYLTGEVRQVVATQEITAEGMTRVEATTLTRVSPSKPADSAPSVAAEPDVEVGEECDGGGFRRISLLGDPEVFLVQWYVDGQPVSQPTIADDPFITTVKGDGQTHVIQYVVNDPAGIKGNSTEVFSDSC